MCYPVQDEPLLLSKRIAHVVVAAGFLSDSVSGYLPYAQ